MDFTFKGLSTNDAKDIVLELYNITGTAAKLPGEIDANFKISVNGFPSYILKISPSDSDAKELDFQKAILQHLETKNNAILAPKIKADVRGNTISSITLNKKVHHVRLLTYVEGRLWNTVHPKLNDLCFSLGEKAGNLTYLLQDFTHENATKKFDWDIAQSLWTKQYIYLFSDDKQNLVSYFITEFESFFADYKDLRKSVVHNDVNDNNCIVNNNILQPKVTAIIDFGDAVQTQIINDVAITCAYAIMDTEDPLETSLAIVKGYHSSFSLTEKELSFLYILIGMRLVISVTKAALNKTQHPDNSYLLVSEQPAWTLLEKWHKIAVDFAYFSFRNACGFIAHPNQTKFEQWAKDKSFSLKELFPTINKNKIHHIDLSVSSAFSGHQEEFNNLDALQFKIEQLQKEVPDTIISGGYLEPRALYTSPEYDTRGNYGKRSRVIHLGIDFWLPAYTPVHALFDGEVVIAVNDAGNKEYGGLVVLKHQQKDFIFYTLYGHNTIESALQHNVGDVVKKGKQVSVLANYPENGEWAPHLHFEIMLSLLEYTNDFPGVGYYHQIEVWKSICPDPNLLFKVAGLPQNLTDTSKDILSFRKQHLGKSLNLQYQQPLHIVKGANQYLIDNFGQKYLDTVNNVAHVGHENFNVVKTGQRQMALLNTNTRYLHENINTAAAALLTTLPKELSVIHFVNSGSEANELALRMVKACTGSSEIIASEHGYHGNTNATINISSYKFDGKGGTGKPKNTHIFPIPNAFRGKYTGKHTVEKYAEEVQFLIDDIERQNTKVGGFIIEPIISCGGQVELPKGFLKKTYQKIKKAGGLCISDEVQTGLGRVGKTFWGFQLHDVIPDIVTIGKPLGNGHPVAAVACTKEVATQFANGMEFFNTFGGNPVSCAIATAVLQEVQEKKLQENALKIGNFLKTELTKLAKEHLIIGDVRGQGLFLGFELVDAKLNPLPDKTAYLIDRMKFFGILMSVDGPDHNVIKIKPPITFTQQQAEEVIFYLKLVFKENFMTLV